MDSDRVVLGAGQFGSSLERNRQRGVVQRVGVAKLFHACGLEGLAAEAVENILREAAGLGVSRGLLDARADILCVSENFLRLLGWNGLVNRSRFRIGFRLGRLFIRSLLRLFLGCLCGLQLLDKGRQLSHRLLERCDSVFGRRRGSRSGLRSRLRISILNVDLVERFIELILIAVTEEA